MPNKKIDWGKINSSSLSDEERLIHYLASLRRIKSFAKLTRRKSQILKLKEKMEDKGCLKM